MRREMIMATLDFMNSSRLCSLVVNPNWANDALAASSVVQDKVVSNSKVQMPEACERNLDVVNYDLEELKGEGRHTSIGKQDVDKPNVLAHDEVVSDMDYFRSRIKTDWSDSGSSDEEVGDDHGGNDVCDGDAQTKSNNDPAEDIFEQEISDREAHKIIKSASRSSYSTNENVEVLGSSRLIIRNLPYTATALVEMDNAIFQGRLLHIMPAKPKNINGKQETSDFDKHPSKTLKQQREEERKSSEARGNTQAWNSLYMLPDTISEKNQYEDWHKQLVSQ